MSDLTDSGVMLRLVYQAMCKLGLDANAVLTKIGASTEWLNDPHLRTPHAAQDLFWKAVQSVSNDPDIGLHLGENLPVYRGQVIEYLFLSSPTFGEGLTRALNYTRLLSDAVQGRLIQGAERSYLVSDISNSGFRQLTECAVAGIARFFEYVTENQFRLREIWFTHETGASAEEYQRVYGCDVKLGQKETRLYFDTALLAHPSHHAEPELLRLHEQVASEKVAALERQDLISNVKRAIGEILESGDVTLESVAGRLNMKSRDLRMRLQDAGTNFNQVFNDYRCRLARRLLAKTDESIDQIVYLTGFSEPSTFYRAFKRWVGETPVEYRKRKQQA
ncbi:MAG TPA: AraC family transcriptional regulator [Pseudomonadales bacterium]|nr:AraC family transcriptional regulator [Pseudomonadales bacterium]